MPAQLKTWQKIALGAVIGLSTVAAVAVAAAVTVAVSVGSLGIVPITLGVIGAGAALGAATTFGTVKQSQKASLISQQKNKIDTKKQRDNQHIILSSKEIMQLLTSSSKPKSLYLSSLPILSGISKDQFDLFNGLYVQHSSVNKILGVGAFGTAYELTHEKTQQLDSNLRNQLRISDSDTLAVKVQQPSNTDDPTPEIESNLKLQRYIQSHQDDDDKPHIKEAAKHVLFTAGMQLNDGSTCIVSKSIPGGISMMNYYKDKNQNRSPEMIKKHMEQMKMAVDLLHEADILHNDISARNFIIDKNGDAILCDFGRALVCQNESKVEVNKDLSTDGPSRWMSKEAIHDHRFSPESDYHALKYTFLEMISYSLHYGGPEKQNKHAVQEIDRCADHIQVAEKKRDLSEVDFFVMCCGNLQSKCENESQYKPILAALEDGFVKKPHKEASKVKIADLDISAESYTERTPTPAPKVTAFEGNAINIDRSSPYNR